MKNLFEINSDEMKRILSLHETSTKQQYLNILTEQVSQNNDSYTLAYSVNLENTKTNAHELKLFKGTVFTQSGKQGILKSNPIKFQYVNTMSGQPRSTNNGVVYYKCKTGKFFIPGNNESFYFEPNMNRDVAAEGIKKVCNYKPGTFINKNQATIGKKYTVYPNTKFNKVTQGATFTVTTITAGVGGFGSKFNALFNCKDSKFYINKEALTEDNGNKLTSTLIKQFCSSQVKPVDPNKTVDPNKKTVDPNKKTVDPKLDKAQKCGHKSWEEYKKSNWACTPTTASTETNVVDTSKLTPKQKEYYDKVTNINKQIQVALGIQGGNGTLTQADYQTIYNKLLQ